MNLPAVLQSLKIEALNPMQEKMLLLAKENTDTLLLAPTGSGKTIAFLLPVLARLNPKEKGVQCLILVPSRELALQIGQVFKQMATGFKVSCCYGGHAVKTEWHNLQEAPALLVGTPGRIAFHLRHEHVHVSDTAMLVLDEFDKSLSLGFEEDMAYITGRLSGLTQRMLTSATRIDPIPGYVGLRSDARILDFLGEKPMIPHLTLKKVNVIGQDRLSTLFRLIGRIGNAPMLIFCNRRETVEEVSDYLIGKELIHDIFHGGMEQDERERALIKFRNGSVMILVATDLASRGLDIPALENIIHYQLPETAETFIHRNGRTARMNAGGIVYLLLDPEERFLYPDSAVEEEPLKESYPVPADSSWKTLYINAGKKDKINKTDIAGLFMKKGRLQKDEVGIIEVKDRCAYVAVKRVLVPDVLKMLSGERIKNKRVKIEAAL